MNKMNVWRGISARLLSGLLLLTAVVATSCSDDDETSGADVTVDFETAEQTVRETDEAAVISMKLSGAASRDGKLTFVVESGTTYGIDYTTSPSVNGGKFVIPIVKGQTAVKFTMFPAYSPNLTGDRTIKFTISEAGAGFKVGDKSSTTVTIVDVNTIVSFAVSATSLSFGDVAKGSESAVKSYTVSGTNLTGNVTVTAPQYYSVSTTEAGVYGATATLPVAAVNAGPVAVYVKFTPASGANQALPGSITNSSPGVTTQSVSVTGNETGNAAVRQTLVLWTFDGEVTTPATDVNGGASVASNADTESFPAGNSSTDSWSHNGWDVGDYNEFTINTTNYGGIYFSFDGQRSGTGPTEVKIQYSTDGTNFTDLAGSNTTTAAAFTAAPMYTFNLSSITDLDNKAAIKVRIVITVAGTAATGTFRVDNVKFEGTHL